MSALISHIPSFTQLNSDKGVSKYFNSDHLEFRNVFCDFSIALILIPFIPDMNLDMWNCEGKSKDVPGFN
jgi:hypothetical protein